MSLLVHYVNNALKNSRSRFMDIYPNPFLIHKIDDPKESDESTPSTESGLHDFNQSKTQITIEIGKTGSLSAFGKTMYLYEIFELVKAPDHANQEVVTIGRHNSNDVIIAKHPISKMHASFVRQPDGKMFLTDVGSRNGVVIRGRKLVPNQPTAVDFGDAVIMGNFAMTLIGAGALYEIIHALQSSPNAGAVSNYLKRK